MEQSNDNKRPFGGDRGKRGQKPRPQGKPTPFGLFTGGKGPALAVYYNLACDAAEAYINTVNGAIVEKPFNNAHLLSDKVLSYLRHAMWKGLRDNKNTSGQVLEAPEKQTIVQLLQKLNGIRNFQSHVWHDPAVLQFDDALSRFVVEKHDEAVRELSAVDGNDARRYLEGYAKFPLFQKHDGRTIITQEGRVFLLAFFLHRGNMAGLLQQRPGSKRNDTPEYQFKHKVYLYYCHREGSAWDATGLTAEELAQAKGEEATKLLRKQQAYKIISYLNDRPAYWGQNDRLPLYYTDEAGQAKAVNDMPGLQLFIQQNGLLVGVKLELRPEPVATHAETDTEDERIENERRKMAEGKKRAGVGYLQWLGNTGHEFEINYAALRHIVGDVLLGRSFERDYVEDDVPKTKTLTAEAHFYEVLRDAIEGREYIYYQLKGQPMDGPLQYDGFPIKKKFNSAYINYKESVDVIDNVFYTKDELRHAPLLPTPKVEKLLIEWHQAFTADKPQKGECNRRIKLLNYIRPAGEAFNASPYKTKTGLVGIPEDTEPQPMVFRLSHYYKEQEQKLRQEDRFLEWGVQYLLDYGLLPGCLVEVEKYVYDKKYGEEALAYKLKRELRYEAQVPPLHRLRMIDGNINIAVPNPGGYPALIKLRMGEKLLKYLLTAVLDTKREGGQTAQGFFNTVAADYVRALAAQKSGSPAIYTLLEPFALPPALLGDKSHTPPVREELAKALGKKMDWLEEQLAERKSYNRNQKNEVVLKAYLLYDFSDTTGKKYLRMNEYEQMSICHYMLNQNPDKVMGLINNMFKLKNRLPEAVYDHVQTAVNDKGLVPRLDVLYDLVLRDRLDFLQQMLLLVKDEGMPMKLIKPQLVYLNLPLSDGNLNPEARNRRLEAREKSWEYLPFAVHPALVLKYFYPQDFAAKKFDGNTTHSKGEKKYNNLLLGLRKNAVNTTALVAAHYHEAAVAGLYDKAAALLGGNALAKDWQALKGEMIDAHTKDVLLSQLAYAYLKSFDTGIAELFANLRQAKRLDIKRLFGTEHWVALRKADANIKAGKGLTETAIAQLPDTLYMRIRLHQADDYFYRMKKGQLYRLALHYVQFRREELAFYSGNAEIHAQISKWPDGSNQAEQAIPLGHLLQEYKRIGVMADRLMGHLLAYERRVIDSHVEQGQAQQPTRDAQLIVGAASSETGYMPFRDVLRLDTTTGEAVKLQLNDLRNQCLHNEVPLAGSYGAQAAPGSPMAQVLGIAKRLAPDREQYKWYEKDTENTGE
jgi:hypothetical protein